MIDDALDAATLLALHPAGPGIFRSLTNQDNRAGAIFGGQPLCQALAAAARTVNDWPAHSLSAIFLRGGIVDQPVDYAVEAVRDGRRFAARRVVAQQDGRPIFDLLASFHDPEEGVTHQMDGPPDVPAPETLIDLRDYAAAQAARLHPALVRATLLPFPVDIRLIDTEEGLFGRGETRRRDFWFRMPSAAAITDPRDRQCLLAFASDYWLAGAASAGHRPPPGGRGPMVASLNHSMWFHGPTDPSQWLLYRTDSPWAAAGRSLARGLIYDRAGRLIASTAQEIRLTVSPPRP